MQNQLKLAIGHTAASVRAINKERELRVVDVVLKESDTCYGVQIAAEGVGDFKQ